MPKMKKNKGAVFCAVAFVAIGVFGGVVTNDYSWVRGTHYRINGDAA